VAKKRSNGEGSITRRKDGLYMARYTVQTATGTKRKTLYGKNREDVAEKLVDALSNRNQGLVFDAGSQTVGEYMEQWLQTSARESARESTYESYRNQVRRYVVPAIGRVKLKRLSAMQIQGMYRAMLDRGLSPRTVQYAHAVLHRALRQAVRWGLVPRNVSEDVDRPRIRPEEIRPLNRHQARHLLNTAGESGDRFEALYVLALHTGMRPGELLGLKWEDVNFDEGGLQLNRALAGKNLTAPKTKRSRRRIDLSTASIAALKAHRKRQLEERMQKAGLWRDHGLVFPSTVGTPLFHRNVVRAFKNLLKRAGLPQSTRLYDLRHTCATLLLGSNVHPKYVQELLGHASIALTLDTYSHVLKGMDGGIGGAMDEALG
jgi:integrase